MGTHLFDELRWAVRHARRRPVFALAVSITLGLSIAAVTTAYGLATAVLWRPLPFHDESRLVFVWESAERDGQPGPRRVTGYRHAVWRDQVEGVFSSMAMFASSGFTLETPAGAVSIRGVRVSAGYFDTLGIRPALGRTFTSADEVSGQHRVIVLSHAFWRERFGSRPDAVGETIVLSGTPHTVIGVMPPAVFPGWPVNPAIVTIAPESQQYWVPMPRSPELDQSARSHLYGIVARMAPGVTAEQAVARLNVTTSDTAPDPHGAAITPLRDQFVTDARAPLLALIGAALALLLIACANLATLYVSAFEARRGELAMRAALGAGLPRLIRQLAVEALLLAGVGAAIGIVLARAALAGLPGLLPPTIPFLTTPALDLQVAAVAIGLALVATMTFTGWPIARTLMLAPSVRGVAARPRALVYRVLVVSQVAVTVALAAAAALLVQSLEAVRDRDPGFTVEQVFVAEIGLPAARDSTADEVSRREQAALAALARVPGVTAVATAYDHPLEANWSESPTIVGDTTGEQQQRGAQLRIVSPSYFDTLGVDILEGRAFGERDDLTRPGATVVNEAMAREIGGAVVGRTLRTGTPRFRYGDAAIGDYTIVGVVRNERVRGLERPAEPAFYLSTRQFPQEGVSVLLRTSVPPPVMAADVRAALRNVDRGITVDRPTSLEAILAEQLAARRVTTDVISGFAGAGLALAALGMYGLLAVLVAGRTREIGVRLAVGATPRVVARAIVGDSVGNAAIGVAIGLGLALVAGRLVQSLLVGVSASDPATLAVVAATLMGVAVIAALMPARRAARVDPVNALRAE